MKLTEILNEILLSEKVKDVQWLQKSYYFASQGHIPLTPNTFAKLLNSEKRVNVFHVTDAANSSKLKALEGTKKSISSMRRIPIHTREDLTGVWGNGVMFSLEGTLLVDAPGDINSSPDEAGRRWINIAEYDHKLHDQFIKYLSQDKRLDQLMKTLEADYDQPGTISKIKLSLSKKEINEFLTLYIQRCMEWIKDNSNKFLMSISKNLEGTYDEIVVNQIKLTGAIVNLGELDGSPQKITRLKKGVEAAVGPENVIYVDSIKNSKAAKATIDKFILSHGGKL